MTGLWPGGPALAGRGSQWYRVRREPVGLAVATVIAEPARGELSVVVPPDWAGTLPPVTALAVSGCLSAAVERSFPDATACGLALEADVGKGWHRPC